MQKLIFASDVRAGGEHESYQHLAWRYKTSAAGLGVFSKGPFFEVTELDGSLYGVVRFETKTFASGRVDFAIALGLV